MGKPRSGYAVFTVVLSLVLAACGQQGSTGDPTAGGDFEEPAEVEFVVHSSPGGGMDIAAREWVDMLRAEGLVEGRWTVSNQSGGSGATAMAYLAQRAGQSDVISGMTTSYIITPLTSEEVEHTILDFTPIAQMVTEQAVVVTAADSPYDTFTDFIDAAREAPGELVQAGGVVTSVDNLARLIIQAEEDVEWNYLNIESGGQRVTALLNGDADILIVQPQEVAEQVRGGEIKVIAAVADEPIALYPEVSTLADQGIDSELPPQTRGILGPPDMPQEAVDYYIEVFRSLTETPSWQEYAEANALETTFVPGPDWGPLLAEQIEIYSELLANIDAEE